MPRHHGLESADVDKVQEVRALVWSAFPATLFALSEPHYGTETITFGFSDFPSQPLLTRRIGIRYIS
jgi:hypothetical protein